MIPFDVFQRFYFPSGLVFAVAIIYFVAGILNKDGDVRDIRACFIIGTLFLVFGCLVLTIPLLGTTGVVNMTIYNKGDGVVMSTSQQEYFLNGDRLVDMKSVVGKQITARVYQVWPNQYPIIYDIDGPVPCGNTTCGA